MLEYVTESVVSGDLVLDLGTKDGRKTANLDARVIGVDLDIGENAVETVTFVAGDGRQLPFRADSFDIVIADQILEHVQDTEAVVSEMARVLDPDGRAYAAFPHRFAPTKPHGLPRWFSMPPLEWRHRIASRLWSGGREEYACHGNHPLTPLEARRIFEDHFRDVRHGTLSFRRGCADRYVREGGPAATAFETVRPVIETVAETRLGGRVFESLWPHPEYVLRGPV